MGVTRGGHYVRQTKARNRSTATGRARRCHTRAPDKSFLKGPQLLTHSKHPFYTTPDRNPTGQVSIDLTDRGQVVPYR